MIIGISGYTGSGKSKIADYLSKKYPLFFLLDADKVARKLMCENAELIAEVSAQFGVVESGTINFKKLSEIVFASVQNLKKLNAITFPFIISAINEQIKFHKNTIIDAPLLPLIIEKIESCDLLIWVESDIDTRIKRLQKRTGIVREQIKERIKSQMDLMQKPETADWEIVQNTSSEQELFAKIDAICK